MSNIEEIIAFNREFVKNRQYENYASHKYPNKKIAVLTCMDTRLTELLPAALNLKNGDVKIIKDAGATVSHPFGSVMRSLIIAVYDLGVEEIMVVGHYDCGLQGMEPSRLVDKMKGRNIDPDKLEMIRYCGIDIDRWLYGFECIEESVRETTDTIRHHPLIPEDVRVYGFIMDPETGRLDPVESA